MIRRYPSRKCVLSKIKPALTPLPSDLGRPLKITSSTKLLAVIGDPVKHSFSPLMQNAAVRALGLDLCYVAFHVRPESVGAALNGMRALNIMGMNVTVPHKEAVIPFLDEISDEAARVGAVNTIHHIEGRLIGYNTDVYGILTSLKETAGLAPLPPTVAVLGASGAARGVVYGLGTRPEVERILIYNRTPEKAESLAREMSPWTHARLESYPLAETELVAGLRSSQLLINTTSVGMHPRVDESPVGDGAALHPDLVVYDIVFNPLETKLIRQAQAVGAKGVGGIEMLVYQGAKSFEIWTGIYPPVEVMKAALPRR
ncbi:MAG: shikimate dehydrogenase [Armatimonadetes bacterium]|nr:shikimate dehydrogenase [Armatimonadota bacterium]